MIIRVNPYSYTDKQYQLNNKRQNILFNPNQLSFKVDKSLPTERLLIGIPSLVLLAWAPEVFKETGTIHGAVWSLFGFAGIGISLFMNKCKEFIMR